MALIQYLEGSPIEIPQAVTKSSKPRRGEGTLSANITHGDIFLTSEHGESYRLSWDPHGKQEPGTRTLPEGVYTLRTYRIVMQHEDETWHTSVTSHKIRTVEVENGSNTKLLIDPTIQIGSRMRGKRGTMSFQGMNKAGLTIYKEGKRIPVGYRVLDASGAELAKGSMRYG